MARATPEQNAKNLKVAQKAIQEVAQGEANKPHKAALNPDAHPSVKGVGVPLETQKTLGKIAGGGK